MDIEREIRNTRIVEAAILVCGFFAIGFLIGVAL